MESSSRKSSPLWETDWQDKVESYWLTGVSHLGSFRRVGVESSSRKSSPPPESEYLAAPQNKGIPRRPPNLNISPPLKTREYLAAPNLNTSPPSKTREYLAAPQSEYLAITKWMFLLLLLYSKPGVGTFLFPQKKAKEHGLNPWNNF